MASEVPATNDLEEDEGAVLAAEGVGVRSRFDLHSSCVDDVRGGFHTSRHQVVEVFLGEDPSRDVPGGRHTIFVIPRCIPLRGEGLCVYGHIDSAIFVERRGRSGWR